MNTYEDSIIQAKFFSLKIDKIQSFKLTEDKCDIYPKSYTKISVEYRDKYSAKNWLYEFDVSCGSYAQKKRDAKKVRQWVLFIETILKNKREIKNAPISNKIYL